MSPRTFHSAWVTTRCQESLRDSIRVPPTSTPSTPEFLSCRTPCPRRPVSRPFTGRPHTSPTTTLMSVPTLPLLGLDSGLPTLPESDCPCKVRLPGELVSARGPFAQPRPPPKEVLGRNDGTFHPRLPFTPTLGPGVPEETRWSRKSS